MERGRERRAICAEEEEEDEASLVNRHWRCSRSLSSLTMAGVAVVGLSASLLRRTVDTVDEEEVEVDDEDDVVVVVLVGGSSYSAKLGSLAVAVAVAVVVVVDWYPKL